MSTAFGLQYSVPLGASIRYNSSREKGKSHWSAFWTIYKRTICLGRSSQATLGGWGRRAGFGVTSADRTLGTRERSGLRSERLGHELWPKTDGPWSYEASDMFYFYDSLPHTVVAHGI